MIVVAPQYMNSGFRPEIAGLRAIAVVGVILFHLKIVGFDGGFIGVDVFFVISGYLISRNILSDLDGERFSFGQFYIRRMRRIFPALIFTVILTYVAGALWCSALMFLDLAKEGTHALLWISNIQYWRESHQYFAPNSDELTLLHCWSLSLEEQFYLVWPLFIVAAHRFGRTFEAVSLAAVVSLLSSIVVARTDPSAAFFLTPFRIYEFGCGALVLFLEERLSLGPTAAGYLSAAGVIAIVASAMTFNADMAHMDVAALLPCLGAAAVIWAGGGTRTVKLITQPIMLGTGAISYSLYLCHWPIIFFARFIFGEVADTAAGTLGQVVAMVALATGMYFFIEQRFIQAHEFRSASFLKNAAGFWSVTLALAAITHATFISKGFAWRLPKAQSERAYVQDYPASQDLAALTGPVGVVFVGDSITAEYLYGLTPLMQQLNISYEARGGAGCPILYGVTLSKPLRRDECLQRRDETLTWLEAKSQPIIYTQNWRQYDNSAIELGTAADTSTERGSFTKLQAALELTIGKIVARGNRVLLVGAQVDPGCPINLPRIQPGPLPRAMLSCPAMPRPIVEQTLAPIDTMLARVQGQWPDKVTLIRVVDYFCDGDCPIVKDDLWLYSNRDHLNKAGSQYMLSRSEGVFRQFLTNEHQGK
jgi:peptidoglycan/LPS O-acetylase OafA/YrhL